MPFAEPPVVFEGIRMASLRDIAAFKLDAIKRRQTKKDFYDLYFLFQLFPLRELLAHYKQMFGFASLTGPLNGLTAEYLERAAESDEPVLLQPVPFEAVQVFIAQTVREFMKAWMRRRHSRRLCVMLHCSN